MVVCQLLTSGNSYITSFYEDITDPSKLMYPQLVEGRCLKTIREGLPILMKFSQFLVFNFRETLVVDGVMQC